MFNIVNGNVIPNPETLAIWPFSQINDRDPTPHKERASQDWKFIEFYCSPKKTNPFGGYPSGIVRRDKIVANIRKIEPDYNIETDELILAAIDQYMEFWNSASPSLAYYNSNLKALKQMENFFNNLDMEKINIKTGMPMYKPKEITSAIADAKTTLTALNSIKDQVDQELYDTTKTKSNRTINHFEE